ncbi:MAG: hypothetical protein DRO67_04040, partial [Candidatus Asgardarchaeum californiense]
HLVKTADSPLHARYLDKIKAKFGEDLSNYKIGQTPSKYATESWEEFKAESLSSALLTPKHKAIPPIKYLKDLMNINYAEGGLVEWIKNFISKKSEDLPLGSGMLKEAADQIKEERKRQEKALSFANGGVFWDEEEEEKFFTMGGKRKWAYREQVSPEEAEAAGWSGRETLWRDVGVGRSVIGGRKGVTGEELQSIFTPVKGKQDWEGRLTDRPAQKAATREEAIAWREAQKKRKEEAAMLKAREKEVLKDKNKVRYFVAGAEEDLTLGQMEKTEKEWKDFRDTQQEWVKGFVTEERKRPKGPRYFVAGPEEDLTLKQMEKKEKEYSDWIKNKDRWKEIQKKMAAIKETMPGDRFAKDFGKGKDVDKAIIEWAKGYGPPLLGGQTIEAANKYLTEEMNRQARNRLDEAKKIAEEFEAVPGKTYKRKTVGPTTDFEALKGRKPTAEELDIYKARHKISGEETDVYGVPTKGWLKAGTDKSVVVVGGRDGKKMHFLKSAKENLKKMLSNLGDATSKLYSDSTKEKQEQLKYMLEDQLVRADNLIRYVQAGGDFGDRAWSEKLGREFGPTLTAFNKLEADYYNTTKGLYRSWTRANVADKYKDIFEDDHYWFVERTLSFFPQRHKEIQKLAEAGKIEEAKEIWKKVKEGQETGKKIIESNIKDKFVKYPGVMTGRKIFDVYTPKKAVRTRRLSEIDLLEKATTMSMAEMRRKFKESELDALKELLKTMSPEKLVSYGLSKESVDRMHTGGRVRKSGPIFLQKGEMVYPQGFQYGGAVHNDLTKQFAYSGGIAAQSLNSTTITVDTSALDAAISKLESLEIGFEEPPKLEVDELPKLEVDELPKLEVGELPKIEIDASNVDLVVDGDAAASKIAAAVANIKVNVDQTGAVGADELKNISDALEDRINSVNVAIEDLQTQVNVITGSDDVDINGIIDGKIAQCTSNFDQKVSDVNANMSYLQSSVAQNKRSIELTMNEMESKIRSLQNFQK